MSNKEQKKSEISLRVPEHLRYGTYSNYFLSQFTEHEFRLHFGYLNPPEKEGDGLFADCMAKINIPTELMPQIIRAMQDNYDKYLVLKKEMKASSGDSNDE